MLLIGIGVSAWPQTKSKTIPSDPPDTNPQYFPKGIFRDSSESGWFHEFKERWYAKHLRAMREPSLSEASKDKSLTAYRFLWLRTFHNPIAIRLNVRPDGTGTLTAKATDGKGGYRPGSLVQNESGEITIAEVQHFLGLLQKSNFWSAQTEEMSNGNDGAEWVVEGIHSGVYHIVDKWSPEKTDYANLCLYLLELSKIKIETKDIY